MIRIKSVLDCLMKTIYYFISLGLFFDLYKFFINFTRENLNEIQPTKKTFQLFHKQKYLFADYQQQNATY